MANYCDYAIKIIGNRNDCRTFVSRLKSYDAPNHFYRIFDVDVYDEESYGEETILYIGGYCAWSLESCCRASGYSNGIDLFEVNTRELNLKMEAFSREPGMSFEEHYIYDKGKCLVANCIDIEVYYWDRTEFPTYEDFKEEYPDAPSEDSFTANDVVYVGGYGFDYMNWTI